MDIAAVKRMAQEAMQFRETVKGLGFTVQLPTDHEAKIETLRACGWGGKGVDPAAFIRLKRALLLRGVVAWSGVTASHLLPGAGSEAVEHSEGAVEMLFDADPEIEEALWDRLKEERDKRSKKQEDAAKN